MTLIWYVLLYSAMGYGLELAYGWWKRRTIAGRRTMLLLPLCPVYGLGAALILALPPWVTERVWLLAPAGGLLATAAEYLMSLFYEKVCRVSFWDYRCYPFQLQGRVCLRFSLYWSLLTLPLVLWVHPNILRLVEVLPSPLCYPALTLFGVDLVVSAWLLRREGSPSALSWQSLSRLYAPEWHG